jgi:hypothetical protein
MCKEMLTSVAMTMMIEPSFRRSPAVSALLLAEAASSFVISLPMGTFPIVRSRLAP